MSSFEEQLNEYNSRLEQEYKKVELLDLDSLGMAKKVRKDLVPWVPVFLLTIVKLAKSAKSEAIRLKASEKGLELVYGKGTPIGEVEDGINNLINQLNGTAVGQSPHED